PPELRAEALKLVSRYKLGPIYTPSIVSTWDGLLGTLVLPSNNGGPNWPGGAVDPQTGILYIYSFTQVTARGLVHDPERSEMEYIQGAASPPAPAGTPATARPATRGGGGRGGRVGGAGRGSGRAGGDGEGGESGG